jgi:hypothetical protein
MSRRLVLTLAAVVILGAAAGIAFTYPSHAYQTAATTVDLAGPTPSALHTYCMNVGAFAPVSPPWHVERWWPLRIGILGAGIALALVLRRLRDPTRLGAVRGGLVEGPAGIAG